MKLVVGLGNPGEKYKFTRHNAGFLALDYFLKTAQSEDMASNIFESSKFNSRLVSADIKLPGIFLNGCLFAYPQTFMNESGIAVREAMQFYKLAPDELLVLHDEIDLPLGTVRISKDSGAAGHNGIKSIIENIGTQDFRRIRIGVESRSENRIPPTEAFVLQKLAPDEFEKIPFNEIYAVLLKELGK